MAFHGILVLSHADENLVLEVSEIEAIGSYLVRKKILDGTYYVLVEKS